MEELKHLLSDAVQRQDLPFAVAMLGDSAGVLWSGAAGEAAPGQAADERTVFRIFSMTKAIGACAAMVLVDRGQLSLDQEVAALLPEFAELGVIESGPRGTRLRPPRRPVTVRHLATHTSGLAYEFWSEAVLAWQQERGAPGIVAGTRAAMAYPLISDPGERWHYGIGLDWLGRVIEAVDGRPVDRFVREEILQPLGMHDTAFEAEPEWSDGRLAAVQLRGEDGYFSPIDFALPAAPEIYGLGHALYASAPDYLRFLRMVLRRGTLDGRRVLSESAVATLLANHIGELTVPVMRTAVPSFTADVDLLPGTRKTHGIAFMRFEDGAPGMRGSVSHGWAGALNTHYWIDPGHDLAAVFMTQSLPFVEPRLMAVYEAFERCAYRCLAARIDND